MSHRNPLQSIKLNSGNEPASESSSESEEYFPELEILKTENKRKDQLINFLQERLMTTPKPKMAQRLEPSPLLGRNLSSRFAEETARRRQVAAKLELLASEIERELSSSV